MASLLHRDTNLPFSSFFFFSGPRQAAKVIAVLVVSYHFHKKKKKKETLTISVGLFSCAIGSSFLYVSQQ